MILVAPPQTPSHWRPLYYVLMASDGACFTLSQAEAVRAQRTGQVDFTPWSDLPPKTQHAALTRIPDRYDQRERIEPQVQLRGRKNRKVA